MAHAIGVLCEASNRNSYDIVALAGMLGLIVGRGAPKSHPIRKAADLAIEAFRKVMPEPAPSTFSIR